MTREESRRTLLGGLGTAAIGALAGCVSVGDGVTEEISRTYETEQLTVETRVGDLTVDTADRDDVLVEGERQANDEDQLDELTLEAERNGDSLALRVQGNTDASGLLFGSTPRIDLNVTVPSSVAVARLETNTGDLTAATGDTETDVETNTGDIQVTDGVAEVRTNTGDVETGDAATPTGVRTNTGDLSVEDGRMLRQVDTDTGDVEVGFPALDGDVSIDTDTGDVALRVAPELDVTADAESSTGDVTGAGQFEAVAQRSGRFEGTLGDGTHRVRVRSSTGDVTVEVFD
ncbi:DUF4097 family beta strand repeat-containing protein [Natranaeroarchaeum aerophilus]|uniref:DUF4097 domain-containing protein n=1 Tax=Natranaeroarchaeum aerophilus TaxID=2917711 RepID=A0AAE3K628_9EURY|nr:DUF4097 family beta strand repeat-containing protein [Natranaeroarchaeum aerophilus]MCL9812339.1 DUF4097 domain-containing protein [Natranaeroarchaeum aerophilus]